MSRRLLHRWSFIFLFSVFLRCAAACSGTAHQPGTVSPTAASLGEVEPSTASAVASSLTEGPTFAQDPRALGVNRAAAETLLRRARESASDALVVWVDGQPLVEWPPPDQQALIETMSVTKSIASLAIGLLREDGELTLAQPLTTWFPQWRGSEREGITLRHILEQTSGLEVRPTAELYQRNDFLAVALESPLASTPGQQWAYNNVATNLVPAVVQQAGEASIVELLASRIFQPLGIEHFDWTRDAQGLPHGMSGLRMRASDLAKIGQLMLDEGRLGERQLISAEWVRASTAPSARNDGYGLLWWLIQRAERCVIDEALLTQWRQAEVPEDFISAIRPLLGLNLREAGAFDQIGAALGGGDVGIERWHDTTWRQQRPDCSPENVRQVGFKADGWLGQYIVVIPSARVVAVRQMRERPGVDPNHGDDTFRDFANRVLDLIPSNPGD